MQIKDRVVVVTGGSHGIGRALCKRFAAEGARSVVIADIDMESAAALAKEIGGTAIRCDVADEAQIKLLVEQTIHAHAAIDLFCSNAGVTVKGGEDVADADWDRLWRINVLSRVFAARAVVPHMKRRGAGYLLHTASAAGLMTEIGSAPYAVTKHADVALAEWLAVRHGRDGIKVSCLCPMGVTTGMLDADDPIHQFLHAMSVTPDDVASAVIEGLAEERFLILPHPEVLEFSQRRMDDFDRYLRAMQRMREKWMWQTSRKSA